jgi:hypothetical protein
MLFFSIGSPIMKIEVWQGISPKYLAASWIIENSFIIAMVVFYDKYSNVIFNHYKLILVVETVVTIIATVLIANRWMDVKIFFIINTLISCTLARTISCCANRLKRLYHNGEDRERFDNTSKIAFAIAGIIGSIVSFLPIPRGIAWTCCCLGCVTDNIFYYVAYIKAQTK